jgi:hypothetical protein
MLLTFAANEVTRGPISMRRAAVSLIDARPIGGCRDFGFIETEIGKLSLVTRLFVVGSVGRAHPKFATGD